MFMVVVVVIGMLVIGVRVFIGSCDGVVVIGMVMTVVLVAGRSLRLATLLRQTDPGHEPQRHRQSQR